MKKKLENVSYDYKVGNDSSEGSICVYRFELGKQYDQSDIVYYGKSLTECKSFIDLDKEGMLLDV